MAKIGCLGRIAPRSDRRTVNFAAVSEGVAIKVPKTTNYWKNKAPLSLEAWGNDKYGCCTIAKQANMFRRFERLEQRRTIVIPEESVLNTYFKMTEELYGGGDTGAYEEDALSRSRREETAIRDSKGRPLMIDAFVRVDAWNHDKVKEAMFLAKGHGLAICIDLPAAFQNQNGDTWDVPKDSTGKPIPPTGKWTPGSWGGHSMWAIDYGPQGFLLEQTWRRKPTWLSYAAAAYYMDECHIVIDSVDAWRKRLGKKLAVIVENVKDAVNAVSSMRIK